MQPEVQVFKMRASKLEGYSSVTAEYFMTPSFAGANGSERAMHRPLVLSDGKG